MIPFVSIGTNNSRKKNKTRFLKQARCECDYLIIPVDARLGVSPMWRQFSVEGKGRSRNVQRKKIALLMQNKRILVVCKQQWLVPKRYVVM